MVNRPLCLPRRRRPRQTCQSHRRATPWGSGTFRCHSAQPGSVSVTPARQHVSIVLLKPLPFGVATLSSKERFASRTRGRSCFTSENKWNNSSCRGGKGGRVKEGKEDSRPSDRHRRVEPFEPIYQILSSCPDCLARAHRLRARTRTRARPSEQRARARAPQRESERVDFKAARALPLHSLKLLGK
jgi:hypothetical protein